MNGKINQAIGCAIGLVASNFLYQICSEKNYALAFDRSFFQCIALLCYVIYTRNVN